MNLWNAQAVAAGPADPAYALSLGIGVLVGGTLIFVLLLLGARWMAKRG
ncbi:MAG: hypothetical protein HY985_17530 [Magnetospirillum sp.]|nr:hypothetical protein [Magnetospirillum sp.]